MEELDQLLLNTEELSKFKNFLIQFLIKTQATPEQCLLLKKIFSDMLKYNRILQLEFALYDFFENLNGVDKKNAVSANELIESLNVIYKATSHLQDRQKSTLTHSSKTKEEKEKFDKTVSRLRDYKQRGEQLVKSKLLSFFSYPDAFIDKKNLTQIVDLLHSRWWYQIDGIFENEESNIEDLFAEFSRLVSFIYDVFSIHPTYLENKKSTLRLFSWELSQTKQLQLNLIEEALKNAMKIASIDLSYDVIHSLIPILKKGSEEISKRMFGKSALSIAIDTVILRFSEANSLKPKK